MEKCLSKPIENGRGSVISKDLVGELYFARDENRKNFLPSRYTRSSYSSYTSIDHAIDKQRRNIIVGEIHVPVKPVKIYLVVM